jgi:NAD(P)H-hydrate repair Nnr-like enzyme with NAD(P)H-hydrate epimerase domain
MKPMATTIKLTLKNRNRLAALKLMPREPYDAVIDRLLGTATRDELIKRLADEIEKRIAIGKFRV